MLSCLVWLVLAAPVPAARTVALERPFTARDGETLMRRLPAWQASGAFTDYALLVAPPSAGGDVGAQLKLIDAVVEKVGAEHVTLLAPPVGLTGWETSNNPTYLPFGGRPALVANTTEWWLGVLLSSHARGLALDLVQPRRQPTADELGAHLDVLIAGCRKAKRPLEVWLPAGVAAGPAGAALTAERVAGLRRVVLTDSRAAALRLAPRRDAAQPPRAEDGLKLILSKLAVPLKAGGLAGDVADEPAVGPDDAEALDLWLTALAANGLTQVVLRGRLDTLEAAPWRELVRSWSAGG
ncbi:MAG: hypothetical protein HYU66_25160 [Armatimonadetes bacterium]|nr:hypothetical protein [Armatimonadota bacterium]